MSEVTIKFTFNAEDTTLQCTREETMQTIFERFSNKISKNLNEIYFLHDGKKIESNLKLSELDKNSAIVPILVYPYDFRNRNNNSALKKSKHIICPKCQKSCLIDIKDYQINLYGCENNHITNNLSFSEFKKSQLIDTSKIICNDCNTQNKFNSFNNQFYRCCNCNKNLCPLCKTRHNKEHKIILDYDLIDFKCNKHIDEKYSSYCSGCNINLCTLCEYEHKNHGIIYYKDLMFDTNKFNEINKFEEKIINLKNYIEEVINKLNKVITNLDIYKNIYTSINCDLQYRNYQQLINIQNINNDFLMQKDIDEIINNDNDIQKMIKIFDIYNKMNIKNDLKIIYKIDKSKDEIKIFGHKFIENNKNICKMLINNKEYEISKTIKYIDYDINKENDYLEIILTNINKITNMSSMFECCTNLYSIPDFSNLNTKNITNISGLFYGCNNLKSLPDISNWNTSNVIFMNGIFANNSLLKTLPDISKWDTGNVITMGGMFYGCSGLEELPDISKWNTMNVKNMCEMFYNCSALKNVPDISKWDTKSLKAKNNMFFGCNNGLNIPIKFKNVF